MRKHFLILMMTLLSVTAFAETDISSDPKVSMNTGNVIYGGGVAPVIQMFYDGYKMTNVEEAGTDWQWDHKYYSDAACTTEAKKGETPYTISTLPAGIYYVQVTGKGVYTGKRAASFEVTKRPVTIAVDPALEKTYGDPDPTISAATLAWATATGFVNEPDYGGSLDAKIAYRKGLFEGTTITYTYEGSDGIANANEGGATYPVTISGLEAHDYSLTVSGGIRINKKEIAEEWFNKVLFSGTYKGAAFAAADLGLTITDPRGTGNADDYVLTSDDYTVQINDGGDAIVYNANAYKVVVAGQGNYKGTVTLQTGATKGLLIGKAPMSVAIANVPVEYKSGAYNVSQITAAIADLKAAGKSPFTYYGFVGADVANQATLIGTFAEPAVTAVAANKNVGEYALTWTDATSANYDINMITTAEKPGKLSIEPKALTITAVSQTKNVGTIDPAITFTISGYAGSEKKADAITTDPVFQRAAGETAGEYAISLKTAAVTKANYTANYVVSIVEAGVITNGIKFTITAGKPMLTILNQTKVYGAEDPATIAAPVMGTNFIVTGLKAGDESLLDGIQFERAAGETVANTYAITLKGTVDLGSDYEPLTVIPGTFSITPAPLAIVINDQTVNKGTGADDAAKKAAVLAQLDPSLVTVTGIAEGDTQDEVFTLDLDDNASAHAGDAGIYVDGIIFKPGTKAANYTYPNLAVPATKAAVAGTLILVDPASYIVLNRPSKIVWEADNSKDDAAKVIADAAAIKCTKAEANTYAATYLGGVVAGDVKEAATYYDEAGANAYNATLPGAKHLGDVKVDAVPYADVDDYNFVNGTALTAEEYAALPAADKIKTPAVLYTDADEVNGINAGLPGAKNSGDEKDAAVLYTDATAYEANLLLPGHITTDGSRPVYVTFSDFAMKAEKWYPLVLPFKTSVKEVSEAFGYAVVNVLKKDNADNTKIAFKLHMGDIDANVPFVVKVYEDMNMNETAFNLIYGPKVIVNSAAPEVEDASGVKFIGSYSHKQGFAENEAFFSVSTSKNDYYWGSDKNKTYMAPLSAYFQLPAGSPARTIVFEEPDGSTTAIEAISAAKVANSNDAIYNLAGQKVGADYKGIVIKNGKRFVQK